MTDHYYIHIPFCRQRCPYCKFALTPVFDEFKQKRYIEYLKKEINTYFERGEAVNSAGFGFLLPLWKILSICQGNFREYFKCTRVGNTRKRDEYRYQNEPGKIGKVFITFCQKVIGWTQEKIEDPETSSGGQKTIYFGGGTPSVLSHDEIRDILECFPFWNSPPFRGSERGYLTNTPPNLLLRYNSSPKSGELETYKGRNPEVENLEITMEMNPEDITHEYIGGVLDLGINRISLGVQTLNNVSLREIHRSDQNTILSALESIGSAFLLSSRGTRDLLEGADSSYRQNDKRDKISLNIDFILGLPFVKPGETLAGIRELHNKFPYITHTSVYMLEDELYPKHWKANSITENEMQTEFIAIIEYFESIGWHHYELSNFAKPGYESAHNQAYWDHSDTRGFGLSAASYQSGIRWSNSSSFTGYYVGKKENEEILTQEQIGIEQMMFGLRRDGINIQDAKLQIQDKKIRKFQQNGLIEITANKIKPTKTGIFVLDHILSELILDI